MIDVDVMKVAIKDLERAQADVETMMKELEGPEMVRAMRNATMVVQRDAKINAPVDTGRLRASITPVVEDLGATIQGVVGSNVTYAPYQEFGPYPKRQYLWRAFRDNMDRIINILNGAVNTIVTELDKKG